MVEQQSEANKTFPQLHCLSSFFQYELNRIEQMIGNGSFNFVVNGQRFKSTLVESTFVSPALEALISSDFNCHEFCISDLSFHSNDFLILLDFIRCDHISDCSSVSVSTSASSAKTFSSQKYFLLICRSFQNK
jgi:hypothetical protein